LFGMRNTRRKKAAREAHYLLENDVNGDEIYFCDRCGEKLV